MIGSIRPCLWFDGRLDEAVEVYGSIFGDVEVLESSRYPDAMPERGGQLLTVVLRIAGQEVMLLNGGPVYRLSPAFSFMVTVADQEELDRLWDALVEGGRPEQCGWLVDRFGVSWQIVPVQLGQLMAHPDPQVVGRVTQSVLGMVKLDIAGLEAAAAG